MLDHPGVARTLQLGLLIHQVEEAQKGVVHAELVLDVLLLPVDLWTPCSEPFQARMGVAWDPLAPEGGIRPSPYPPF